MDEPFAARHPLVAIAEDDDAQREALCEILEGDGFSVIAFEDGYELCDYLSLLGGKTGWPDAIVTDVSMPGRSGLDAAELARAMGAQVPVFVVTGCTEPDLRERVARLGNAFMFQKPIDADCLSQAIARLAK